MADIAATDTSPVRPPGSGPDTVRGMSLAVREPRQRRTRQQWATVLDAGVAILEEGGYEAFTIPALCERAGVPPRALYARADSKDALFLAVYEHGVRRIMQDHAPFDDDRAWQPLSDGERIGRAVEILCDIFERNRRLLRAIVLISGAHPEVARRGVEHRAALCAQFVSVLAPIDARSAHADPLRAREFAFALVFSALVVRTAYGAGFGIPAGPDELTEAASRYLLTP